MVTATVAFDGKDTTAYKLICEELKTKFFPKDLPTIDLISIVIDDELLVKLFIERLVLDFTGAE
jgi:hypothetical protein